MSDKPKIPIEPSGICPSPASSRTSERTAPSSIAISPLTRNNDSAVVRDPEEVIIPHDLEEVLTARDGASRLCDELPKRFTPTQVATENAGRIWELCGIQYLKAHRLHEALAIFSGYYDHLLQYQDESGEWVNKGTPLVWLADAHSSAGHVSIAKRFLMLTLCEDAISGKSAVPADSTGVYFRLVWNHGMSDTALRDYAKRFFEFSQEPMNTLFPEASLLEVDDLWMTEMPSTQETLQYWPNRRYVTHLINQLGAGQGKELEKLAHYLVSVMPGCRVKRRQLSHSTDYDLVCCAEGLNPDFRSELGRFFICECKDWSKAVDFTTMAKFCRVLDGTKCRFGILFSRHGISGKNEDRYAEREQLKVYQDRGIVIIVIDESDLDKVASGANFATMLRSKYERVRLDLRAQT